MDKTYVYEVVELWGVGEVIWTVDTLQAAQDKVTIYQTPENGLIYRRARKPATSQEILQGHRF